MPLINNSTGVQIHGGSFYEVSGDVNLESHQHLTIQDHWPHGAGLRPLAGSISALEDGWTESSSRELSGAGRNPHRGARQAPYAASSRPHLLRDSSNPVPSSSGQPRLGRVPSDAGSEFSRRYIATSSSLSIGPPPFSDSLSTHPLDYQHSSNTPHLGSCSTRPHQNHPTSVPSDWSRNDSLSDFEHGRQASDNRADSFGSESRYQGPLDRFQAESPPSTHGGIFITAENVNHNHHHGETGIHLLHRGVVLEALHDSAESFPQPRSHSETRAELLERISNWTKSTSSSPILWLHGAAGAGKSAIMRTVAQDLQDSERLGASFFFRRDHTTRGNAKGLIATLAYQLALNNPALKPHILQAVENDPSVVGRGMAVQLRKLILEPCRLLTDSGPQIMLIDGLDECEDPSVQLEILRLIGSIVNDHSLPLRFIIASRPEVYIREKLEESFHGLYDSINLEQSFEDVRTDVCATSEQMDRKEPQQNGGGG
ncbi:hypothetical protein FB451DRAFT_1174236 [Mycena latifolia]|nr:hypothetical protein FB451DRAFT_1174236 [Mycena latifolia]